LLNPEGTQQWEGKAQNGKRGKHFRGYLRSQFVSSWERHLPSELLAQNTLQRSGVSGVSGEIQQNQALNYTPDTLVDNGIRCSPPEPVAKSTPDADPYTGSPIPKNPSISAIPPDTPDVPEGLRVCAMPAAPAPSVKRRPSRVGKVLEQIEKKPDALADTKREAEAAAQPIPELCTGKEVAAVAPEPVRHKKPNGAHTSTHNPQVVQGIISQAKMNKHKTAAQIANACGLPLDVVEPIVARARGELQ
jgi:hypothetical protein